MSNVSAGVFLRFLNIIDFAKPKHDTFEIFFQRRFLNLIPFFMRISMGHDNGKSEFTVDLMT